MKLYFDQVNPCPCIRLAQTSDSDPLFLTESPDPQFGLGAHFSMPITSRQKELIELMHSRRFRQDEQTIPETGVDSLT